MTGLIAWVIAAIQTKIGRWIAVGGVSVLALFGAYLKGKWEGRAQYKEKIERQIKDAVQKGDSGRADALRKFDDGQLPNSWFRD